MTGREVFSQKLQGLDHELIRLNDQFQTGSYIIRIVTGNGSLSQLLLVE